MARYIDAELFDKKLAMEVYLADDEDFTKAFVRGMELVKKAENEIPTADVQEVRHGKWIGYPSISISKRRRTVQSIIYKCSCCGKSNGRAKSPYCKNCGSKMCGDESEAKIEEVEEKE